MLLGSKTAACVWVGPARRVGPPPDLAVQPAVQRLTPITNMREPQSQGICIASCALSECFNLTITRLLKQFFNYSGLDSFPNIFSNHFAM